MNDSAASAELGIVDGQGGKWDYATRGVARPQVAGDLHFNSALGGKAVNVQHLTHGEPLDEPVIWVGKTVDCGNNLMPSREHLNPACPGLGTWL